MACGCGKGGKKSLVIKNSEDASLPQDDSLVLMQYTGKETGTRRLKSRVHPNERYAYSESESQFLAYQGDVDWLTSLSNQFVVIKNTPPIGNTIVDDLLPLESKMEAPDLSSIPVDVLRIDPVIIAKLKQFGYDTLQSLRLSSDADLLSLKGLGSKRVSDIRKALNAV